MDRAEFLRRVGALGMALASGAGPDLFDRELVEYRPFVHVPPVPPQFGESVVLSSWFPVTKELLQDGSYLVRALPAIYPWDRWSGAVLMEQPRGSVLDRIRVRA